MAVTNLMTAAARTLLPRGVFGRDFHRVYRAISQSLQRAYEFSRGTLRESRPGAATDTIDQWAADLAVDVSKINDIGTKRRRVATAWFSAGGQSLEYVEGEIRRELNKISISETATNQYEISGDVQTTAAYQRLQGLVGRLAPLHAEPTYSVRIIEGLPIARHGVGATGTMRTGKEE
jgi:uncharacterized protein YmfQ (DUF2313 family)